MERLNTPRLHGFDESGMVAFGLVAVGFGELGERGGEGVGLADVAGDLGDVAGASVRAASSTPQTQPQNSNGSPVRNSIGIDALRFFICRTK